MATRKTAKPRPLTTAAKLDVLAHGLHALESAQGAAAAPAAPTAAPAAGTHPIGFTVSNATAKVRITLVDDPSNPEVVVPAGATTGTSAPRPNHTLIDTIVELLGSSGQGAHLAITNVDTPSLDPAVPNDYKGSWYPIHYTLKTSG
jgi:hypothetical protein